MKRKSSEPMAMLPRMRSRRSIPMMPISLRQETPLQLGTVFEKACKPDEQVQIIANMTIVAARTLRTVDRAFRVGWDNTWTGQLGAVCATMKDAAQTEGRKFVLRRALPDALIVWWQQQEGCIAEIGTATRIACDQVLAREGSFDFSDTTTVLRAEYSFAITLQAIGGLNSLERMGECLRALEALAADYRRYPLHHAVSPAIRNFVRLALPLILSYTSWLGASVAGVSTGP